MNEKGNIERLTWKPGLLMPFESGWSVLSKVIALNNLTLSEFGSLIKKVECKKASPFNILKSSWIDFKKYANLLDENEAVLKSGFWDQIGIKPQIEKRYARRYCPKCEKEGHQCLLFDLTALSECPWHRCPLTDPCNSCCFPRTFSIRTMYGTLDARFCEKCGTKLPTLQRILDLEPYPSDYAAKVLGYCRELVDWWIGLGKIIPNQEALLSSVLHIGVGDSADRSHLILQRGLIEKLSCGNLFWSFKYPPNPVILLSWKIRSSFLENEDELDPKDPIFNDEQRKMYRCLRRHLYKKFVRPHKKAYGSLLALDRNESLSLKGESICLPVLAFVAWRMSIENIRLVQGLRLHRKGKSFIRLIGPPENIDSSLTTLTKWSYCTFFSLWRTLIDTAGKRNFRIDSYSLRYGENTPWLCASHEVVDDVSSNEKTIQFQILYPDMSQVETKKTRVYLMQYDNLVDFTNLYRLDPRAESLLDRRSCLFQIRYSQLYRSSPLLRITI